MLNIFLQKRIERKAKWVNRRYPGLSMQDLIQEAGELIAKLKRKHGVAITIPYLLTAISYHFNNLMRLNKTERGLQFYDIDSLANQSDQGSLQAFENVDNNIDRERFMKSIKDNNLLEVLNNLCIGESPDEIAVKKGCSKRQIYRYITNLKRLRKEWEK